MTMILIVVIVGEFFVAYWSWSISSSTILPRKDALEKNEVVFSFNLLIPKVEIINLIVVGTLQPENALRSSIQFTVQRCISFYLFQTKKL